MGPVTMDELTESTFLVSRFHKFAHDLPISNDSTERMIKRTSNYSNFGAKNEDDFQAILTVVKQVIERLPSRSGISEGL